MGCKLSQYDYSFLTPKSVNLIQEKTANSGSHSNHKSQINSKEKFSNRILYNIKYYITLF